MVPLEIRRSSRKTLSLEITAEGKLLARAPYRMSEQEILLFAEKKADWIQEHMEMVRKRRERQKKTEPLSERDLRELAKQAARVIPQRVAFFAEEIGVTYGRITIRSQRTRWGSCSAKGNLNFNCLLMLTPGEVLDYVVVHELCHRLEMNHSVRFWREVERILPDYRERRRWLKENGGELIGRMRSESV